MNLPRLTRSLGAAIALLLAPLAIASESLDGYDFDLSVPGRLGIDADGDGLFEFRSAPSVTFERQVAAGDDVLTFVATTDLSFADGLPASVAFVGAMSGEWSAPFGVEWLTIRDLRLAAHATGGGTVFDVSGACTIAGEPATARLVVADGSGESPVRFDATLERIGLDDVVEIVFGGAPAAIDDVLSRIAELSDVTISIDATASTVDFSVAASCRFLDETTDILISAVDGADAEPQLLVALHRSDMPLSAVLPLLAGTPAGDLRFEDVLFVATDEAVAVGSDDLDAAELSFFRNVHAEDSFEVALAAGLTLQAAFPFDQFPSAVVSALGFDAADPRLVFEGEIDVTLGQIMDGDADVEWFRLSAEFPGTQPLPGFDALHVSRTVELVYDRPQITFSIRNVLRIEIDGAVRTFVVTGSLGSDGENGSVELEGLMDGQWVNPFGIEWLTLEEVRLTASAGSDRESSLSLESSFRLGESTLTVVGDVTHSDDETSVSLKATCDLIPIDELIQLVLDHVGAPLFDGAVPQDFAELRDVVIAIEAGSTRALRIAATSRFGDVEAELLWSVSRAAGEEAQIVLAVHPTEFSLTSVIPALSGPIFDNLEMPDLALVVARIDQTIRSTDMSTEEAAFYGRIFGGDGEEYSFSLGSGVNVFAPIPIDLSDSASPITMVMNALNVNVDRLVLEGRIECDLGALTGGGSGGGSSGGFSASLRIPLPAWTPPSAPDWFVSGQLALAVGVDNPSFALEGAVTVDVDGDVLTFFLRSAIGFGPGGASLSLTGGLDSEDGWVAPMDIEWLTIHRLVATISVSAVGSLGLGFAGDVEVGTKDLAVAVFVAVNASGVPTNLIVEGSSEAGFTLSDIAALQSRIADHTGNGPMIPLDALPDMAVTSLHFKFAPTDQPDLGIERGLAIAGELWIANAVDGALERFAFVDFSVDESGISGDAALGAFSIGALDFEDGELSVGLSLADQHLNVTARLSGAAVNDVMNQLEGLLLVQLDAAGRAVDVAEAALATTAAALEAAETALDQLEAAIAAARITLDAAKKALDQARATKESARRAKDAAHALWAGTPSSQPVLKAARWAAYLARKAEYEAASAVEATRSAAYEAARVVVTGLEAQIAQAQATRNALEAELDRLREELDALEATLDAVASLAGPGGLEVDAMTFRFDLASVAEGADMTLDADVRVMGTPSTIRMAWSPDADLASNVATLMNAVLAL